MNPWTQYLNERYGHECIEEEWGFVTYKLVLPFIALEDLYIVPELRKLGAGTKALKRIEDIGRAHQATHVWAQVQLMDRGSNESLQAILAVGFKMIEAQNNRIVLTKEIEGV